MYRKNVSGQFLYVSLVSALSGNPVTGQVTGISGRRSIDGASQILISGTLSEIGGGQYVANLYDFDLNGNNIGFLFTASGCVPVNYTVLTVESVSGRIFVASGSITSGVISSGVFVSVPIASISGNTSNSGLTVSVLGATLSGTLFLSSGAISGQLVDANLTKWLGILPNALISSGRVDAAFNVRTSVARSGTATTIQLDAGVPTGISGSYDGAVLTIVGGTGTGRSRAIQSMGSSGIATVFPAWDASGVPDTTSIFTLTPGALTLSGLVYPASGANAVVPIASISGLTANSGLMVSVLGATISGTLFLSSGALSGQFVTPQSGTTFLASGSITSGVISSGVFVSVPIASISGNTSNSGLTVSVLGATISGSLFLSSGSLSGQLVQANVTQWLAAAPNALVGSGKVDSATNMRAGLARSGTATTIQLDAGTPAGISGVYDNQIVNIVGGTGAGRSRTIQNYSASGICTVLPAWDSSGVPDTTTQFIITPGAQTFSGLVNVASGANVVVPITSISGLTANSGLTVTVLGSTLSGTLFLSSGALSGQIVTAQSGQTFLASGSVTSGVICSGVFVTATATIASGQLWLASGSITSGVICSGVFVTATASIASGQVWLASGSITSGVICSGVYVNATASVSSGSLYLASGSIFMNTFASGVVGGGSGNIPSAWGGSGAGTVGQNLDKAGYSLSSGSLSGQQVTPQSGTTFLASGSVTSGVISSGIFVTATATIASGQLWLASGSITSGVICSGVFVTVPITSVSGLTANSGLFVTVPIATISGLTANSGLNVTVPVATISGVFPASGSLSGQQVQTLTNLDKTGYTASVASGQVWLASGSITSGVIASGVYVTVPITSISGLTANSGLSVTVPASSISGVYLASGSLSGQQVQTLTNLDKSGYTLGASGLDTVLVEKSITAGATLIDDGGTQLTTINFRQAQALMLSTLGGRLSGAGTTTINVKPAAQPTSGVRVQATVDSSGNRTGITLRAPV